MNASDLFSFLCPKWDDPLQLVFSLLFVGVISGTVVAVHLRAKVKYWEKKWNRGTPKDHSDDLDIEQGSVTDLWHAVATVPEKLAEIMPGMLLVMGLLGTFIGLGIALNHASELLSKPDAMDASGASSGLQELMKMLQGLGTKFKTSTWGIIGFIAMKVWSECVRYEEKRLSWVISKAKGELERRKLALEYKDTEKQNALLATISTAAALVADCFTKQTERKLQMLSEQYQATSQLSKDGTQLVSEKLQVLSSEIVQFRDLVDNNAARQMQTSTLHYEAALQFAKAGTESLRDDLKIINGEIRQFSDSFAAQTELQSQAISQQHAATAELVKSLTHVLSRDLQKIICDIAFLGNKIAEQLTQELQNADQQHAEKTALIRMATSEIREEMLGLHQEMQEANASLEIVSSSSETMQSAIRQFSEGTQGIVKNMADAAEQMTGGATQIGVSAGDLVDVVHAFENKFNSVLDKVGIDLGHAIDEMSAKATESLESGASQLGNATRGISTALGVLSGDVNRTMNAVQESIEKSNDIQKRAQVRFISSSDALQESVTESKLTIGQIGETIYSGLKAISDSSQHVKSVGRSLEKAISTMDAVATSLASLPKALSPLGTLPEQHQAMHSQLVDIGSHVKFANKMVLGSLENIIEEIQGITVTVEETAEDEIPAS